MADHRLQLHPGTEDAERIAIERAATEVTQGWPGIFRQVDGAAFTQFAAVLSGQFELNSPLTGENTLEVATLSNLQVEFLVEGEHTTPPYPQDWGFSEGILELTTSDGSALRLDADSGDQSMAEITLLQDGEILETFLQPWPLWYEQLTTVAVDPRYRL